MKKRKKMRISDYKHRRGKSPVRAKKSLGQHFLKDESIAKKISETLTLHGYSHILEIGPGTGILTKHFITKGIRLVAMDLDQDSITYLRNHLFTREIAPKENQPEFELVHADFLKYDLRSLFGNKQFAIVGNFPYNISTQIVFKMLEHRHQVPEFSGMFQREVAMRICSGEGSKTYGILSVLVQAFYDAHYLFSVPPEVFEPPPKVVSGVIKLVRKDSQTLACDEKLFFRVVKTAFNQRRKTLRNSLKAFGLSEDLRTTAAMGKRPEQLSVDDFIALTRRIQEDVRHN